MKDNTFQLPLRVLVVDDHRDAAEMLAMMVGLSGATTVRAHSGNEALALAESFRPHLVLLDLNMPEMSGYDVIKAMRQMTCLNNPVVVAVTGWDDRWTISKTRSLGFDRHLTKPAEQNDIYDIVLFALARVQAGKSLLASA
jgi:CheY-like chemotaxis protein